MKQSFDTIVIGAGLAGIAATRRLTAAGQRVALVEARSRFGGRVWTHRDPAVDYPVELGPEWLSASGSIHRFLAGIDRPMPEADGEFLRLSHGEWTSLDAPDGDWFELRRRLNALQGPDRSIDAALAECCHDGKLDDAAQNLRRFVEGFNAADASEVSLEWIRQVEANQPAGESSLRSRDGLDVAVDAMLTGIGATCTVFLDTVVRGVRWQRDAVAVDCESRGKRGTLHARAAMVTLPSAVLERPDAVRFTPALSSKQPALRHIATGPVIKLNLVFDAPFWRDIPRLDTALFMQDPSQPIPTWWTMLPEKAPVLVGWVAGAQVERVGSVKAEALRRTAVRSLAGMLHVPVDTVAKRLRSVHWHDWQRDPFACGAYTWVRAGGVDAYQHLGAPLDRTLYFAGEATRGNGFNATMDGAIDSGERAANDLLAGRVD